MYLRHTTRKKDGKVHRYWRLVRSVRVGRRVIQQTVAHLGELDEHGRVAARVFARTLIGAPEQAQLFDDGSAHLTVPWEKMAVVLVAARLCEPSSKLHIAEDWYRRTALADLLQLKDEHVDRDRLHRALDEVLIHKAAIEAHLSQRCGELFSIQNEVLLYDVTSTYFEGQAEANPLAQRGYSRDHRPDCKQVCIALVVTLDGFPVSYEVFPGNTHDSRTLQTIVATMEARHGVIGRVWITDLGMASAANLAWLRETGRRYIIGAPKSELEKFGARIEASLTRLASRIDRSSKRIDPTQVNRQIGRILQQNQRAAARFDVRLVAVDCAPGCRLEVRINAPFDDWAAISEGAYLLRSNITDWSDEQLWKACIQLTQTHAHDRTRFARRRAQRLSHRKPKM